MKGDLFISVITISEKLEQLLLSDSIVASPTI